MDFEDSKADVPFDRRSIPAHAVESYWHAPGNHTVRRIDWPEPSRQCRGSLLFLPGRADFYEKYLETLEEWHRQGWRVTSSDWRGQGLSGRLGFDGQTGHVGDFAQWVEDLAAFWPQWIASTPAPHVVVGHSMGSHIALRAIAERRVAPVAAVLIAPMLGFVPAVVPLPLQQAVAWAMAKVTRTGQSAWTGNERPAALLGDRSKLLTHDEARYEDESWWRRFRPDLAMTAPSWGWIERAIASMRVLRRRGLLEAIETPVLFVAAEQDRLVDFGAIRRAAERMPNAEIVTFGSEARHEILREADEVRDKAMEAIAAFLAWKAPAQGNNQ